MTIRRVPHKFTVAEYDRMIDLGILKENARVELIRGEIVAKMPIGDPHVHCVNRLNRLMVLAVGENAIVSIQNPVRLADSEPEPELVLMRPNVPGKPWAADVLLIVEVADSTLDDDREVKGPLYAENGIAEFWIVNLVDAFLEVHRGPQPTGTYADVRVLRAGERVALSALPGVEFEVADLIGR